MTAPGKRAVLILVIGLCIGSALAAGAALRTAPSAVVVQEQGHPGRPFTIGDGGLVVSGEVGSIVHVRLPRPLPEPDSYGRDGRFSVSGSGDWAALLLAPEAKDGASDQLLLYTGSEKLTCQGPCPDNTFRTAAISAGTSLPMGDYVLALAGPPGAQVSALLKGRDPTLAPTRVRGLYPMPFVSGPAPDPQGTVRPHRAAVAGLARPSVGRRTLGVVVVGVHERGLGKSVDVKLCVGGFLRNDPADAAQQTVQPGCSGGNGVSGSEAAAFIPLDATVLTPPDYAALVAQSITGTFEINSGGGWAASCEDNQCTFDGRVFDVALDS